MELPSVPACETDVRVHRQSRGNVVTVLNIHRIAHPITTYGEFDYVRYARVYRAIVSPHKPHPFSRSTNARVSETKRCLCRYTGNDLICSGTTYCYKIILYSHKHKLPKWFLVFKYFQTAA